MLDIKFIRENPEVVREGARKKQMDPGVIDRLLDADKKRRQLTKEAEDLRARRNLLTKDSREEGLKIKEEIKKIEPQLKEAEEDFKKLMYEIPNYPASDVPYGEGEADNVVISQVGQIPSFSFTPKDHAALGKDLDLVDLERGVKIGGFRSFFTKNELVSLEYGLLDYALKLIAGKGFTPMTVPWMVKPDYFLGTGYFPWGQEDHYATQDGLNLIGTAEVSLTSYFADEVLKEEDLPVKLAGISPCFRREVGTYGKDMGGIFRIHQFNKVEQVVLCKDDPQESITWHEKMRGYAEELLTALKLPYRVLLMCTGDMGGGQKKKYDLETWFPSQNKYRETHSDSYFWDFQARRLNIRYKTKGGEIRFVHTLNNTVVATPRILGAILENYQKADGSVSVPEVLRPYVGKDTITPKS
jgi:seryl-tRNA synthetase